LAAMDSRKWWPFQQIVLPHEEPSVPKMYGGERIPQTFRATLSRDDRLPHIYIFPFRYKQPPDHGDLFSLIVVQMEGKPSEATERFCHDFSSAVCAADGLARLVRRQQHAYDEFEDHIKDVRHDLLTSAQYLVANIESLMKTANAAPATVAVVKGTMKKHSEIVGLLKAPTVLPLRNNLESIDAIEAVRRLVDQCATEAAAKGVSFDVRVLKSHDAYIVCDPAEFHRAVLALLDNAVKYSYSERIVNVRLRSEGGALRIEVENYGIGIPPETIVRLARRGERAEVHDPFVRREGAGLGFAIARHVFEDMLGGTVTVRSERPYVVTGPALDYHRYVTQVAVTIPIQEQSHG
jgi:signal transduction histidine kinase